MGKMVPRIYFAIILITWLTAGSSLGQSLPQSSTVTAVTGESWLVHLHRTFDETSMGKTGRLGPPELVQLPPAIAGDPPTVVLSGADLYRLNCRGCHGELGAGAPPEINSVINPVRATSVAAIMARMKNAGANISRAEATTLAEQSKSMLLERLHHGGQDMPPFPQLTAPDIKALTGYLKQLAEVPGAEQEHGSVPTSPLRVGELIVKSTCHTCHSSTGSNPTPRELADGAIPPLSALTSRVNRAEFLRKVTNGAPVIMGQPALLYRGRMPVFYYLTAQEAADIYEYLLAYPPKPAQTSPSATALSQSHSVAEADLPAAPLAASPAATVSSNRAMYDPLTLSVAGLLVMLLLVGGAALTIWEMKKLASTPVASDRSTPEHPQIPVSSIERDLVA